MSAPEVLAGTRRHAVIVGHALDGLRSLPDGCVQTCVTSPPYFGLRDYGVDGQIGQETSPAAFVEALVTVFREVRRVLADDGTLWLNLGDSYAANRTYQVPSTKGGAKHAPAQGNSGAMTVPEGLKAKDLMGVPWRVALALQADGWWLRSDIIWSKPNPMPESVTDRPTRAHEYVFLLSKRERYFYDANAIREDAVTGSSMIVGATSERSSDRKSDVAVANGRNVQSVNAESERRDIAGCSFNNNPRLRITDGKRNARSVWTIVGEPFDGAHFATMPPELARRCILAGSRRGDVVLDPFAGAGTTSLVAVGHGRRAIGCELNPEYAALALDRVAAVDTDATVPVRVEAPQWGALFGGAP